MKKYFLTGATGILGREVTKKIIENGDLITILTRNIKNKHKIECLGGKAILGDIIEEEKYKIELNNSDIIIHMAAEVFVGNSNKSIKNKMNRSNIEGTTKIFNLFKKSECRQLIFTSTRQIFGKTNGIGTELSQHNGINQSFYVKTKYYGHKLASDMIKEGYPVTIIIPGTIYSPEISDSGLGKLFRLYNKGQKMMIGSDSFNSYLDSNDAANGIIATTKISKAIGEEYILTNGFTTYKNIYSICEEVTGIKKPKFKLPIFLGRLGANLISPLLYKFGKEPLLNKEIMNNIKNSCKLSNEKSIKDLNIKYKPLLNSIKFCFNEQYLKMNIGQLK